MSVCRLYETSTNQTFRQVFMDGRPFPNDPNPTWLGYSIQGDRGLLFCMALVSFACGLTVTFINRHKIPGYVPSADY